MTNYILEYHRQIESGEIIACDKIQKLYQKLANDVERNDSEWYYNHKRAMHAIQFIENFCRHSKGKMGGQKVILELWQKALISAAFGFVDIEGLRKYRKVLLIVAKKNGKSLLASAIGLYLQVADNEAGPEVVACATKKDQAKIIWSEAKRMVKKSPVLRKRIKPLVAELVSDFNDGSFKPLASDSDTLDGLNIHGALMDEIHQWKNGKVLYDIVADGTSAREQPMIFITSTAGTVREDIYDMEYEDAVRVINGYTDDNGYQDERLLPVIYELDDRKEWVDHHCWMKANPGLGTIKNLQTLKEKVEKAQSNPMLVKNLVCKEFNIRETSSESWLTFETIKNPATYDISKLNLRYAIGGIDLSSTTDLTCATVLFRVPNDPTIYVHQMYWLPVELLEQRVREDKIPYNEWLDQGWLRVTEGNRIDYKEVALWFEEVQEKTGLYMFKIGYDSWSAQYLVDDLKRVVGKNGVEPVIQGHKTMSGPMKNIKADLEAKRINYNNSPILKWNLVNAAVQVDRNDNIALVKTSHARKRIDGVASLIDAYVVYERYQDDYINMVG